MLFGREAKAFSKQSTLRRHELVGDAGPLLEPLLANQDAAIDRLDEISALHRKRMPLVRRNSHSVMPTRNRV